MKDLGYLTAVIDVTGQVQAPLPVLAFMLCGGASRLMLICWLTRQNRHRTPNQDFFG
jgi:hypothetical protein